VLRSYLPAIVFVLIGAGLGGLFVAANSLLGPRGRRRDHQPYECGLPSDVRRGFRFGVSFYLVAILFIIFDIEVILLLPVALQVEAFGWHGLGAVGLFIVLLGVAFIYEWRRGSLQWDDRLGRGSPATAAGESGHHAPPPLPAGVMAPPAGVGSRSA
jgi:NADH-quinone oxidoreductase subunit A